MIIKHTCYPHRAMIVYPYDIRHKLYDINILDDRLRPDDQVGARATLISKSLANLIISGTYGGAYNIYTDLIDLSKLLLHRHARPCIFIYRLIKFFTLLIHLPTFEYDS